MHFRLVILASVAMLAALGSPTGCHKAAPPQRVIPPPRQSVTTPGGTAVDDSPSEPLPDPGTLSGASDPFGQVALPVRATWDAGSRYERFSLDTVDGPTLEFHLILTAASGITNQSSWTGHFVGADLDESADQHKASLVLTKAGVDYQADDLTLSVSVTGTDVSGTIDATLHRSGKQLADSPPIFLKGWSFSCPLVIIEPPPASNTPPGQLPEDKPEGSDSSAPG